MSTSSRFKKFLRQSSVTTSKSPPPPPILNEGERKINDSSNVEDDNILNLSKSSANDKTSKAIDRRTGKTKRGDVKARSVNLGGLIGLWKGIESLEKDGSSETAPVPQNRTPSLERKTIKEQNNNSEQKKEKESKPEPKPDQPTKKERKISIGRKSESEKRIAHEKAVSLKKDQVEQTPPKDKSLASYKDIDGGNAKDILKDSKQKPSKTSNDSSVTSLLSRTFEGKAKNDTKSTDGKRQPFGSRDVSKTNNLINHDKRKQVDAKSSSLSDSTKKFTTPTSRKSETPTKVDDKIKTTTPPNTTTPPKTTTPLKTSTPKQGAVEKLINKSLQLNGSNESPPGTPELRRNSRTGSLRRGEVKRASFRRRSKVDSDTTKLAEDFDKIFKRLSIGSELSASQHDISTILDQVSENQERENQKRLSDGDGLQPTTTREVSEETAVSRNNSKTNEINRNGLKATNNKNEKTVLNDKTNTLRKTPTSPTEERTETSSRTKVSNFEGGLQKGRDLQERNNKLRRNEGNSTLADRNDSKTPPKTATTSPRSPKSPKSTSPKAPRAVAGPKVLSPKSEKKRLVEKQKLGGNAAAKLQKKDDSPSPGSNNSNQPKQKTATQAKLEEIAARREALRKKYLERSHSENSICLEKKERFRRQGFAEGDQEGSFDITDDPQGGININLDKPLTCEVASVTTNILSSSDAHSPESNSTDSGFSADSRVTQVPNRTDNHTASSSNEDKAVDKKKKKLIRKTGSPASAVSTPPVRRKNRDVQKILRRLSLNIPPPTPEEIEEEMEKGQDLTELERRKLALERRRRSLQQSTHHRNSTDNDDNESENSSANHRQREDVIDQLRLRAHDNSMDNNDADELDQMISKQNRYSKNNLSALSEQKFKTMKSQGTLERSSSEDEPARSTKRDLNNNNNNNSNNKNTTFGRESMNPAIKTITAPRRGSLNEKKQKLFEPAKDIPIVRTKPVAEVKDLVTAKLDNKNNDSKKEKKMKKERMMSKEPPTVETFKKQSAWLEKLVQEAAVNEKLGPDHTKPKDYVPTKGGRRSKQPVEPKPEIDIEAIRENIVDEPTNLGERKKWLEKLVRRSTIDKKSRLSKTRSLCNLSQLDFDNDDDDNDEEDDGISKPISRQVSVEEISKTIDLESRGSAFMLPSAIRQRRSMGNLDNLEQCYTPDRRASCGTLGNFNIPLDLQDRLAHLNGGDSDDSDEEEEVDPNLKETIEAIQLPNIHERMSKFQETTSSAAASPVSARLRRRSRKERPKSYAGEHLSQLVFENGSFRPKDGQILGQNAATANNEIASSIGKAMMVNDNSSSSAENAENTNSNETNNNEVIQTSETPREMMQRKRQNRRSLFSNQRILAEIAEMEQREQEIIDERTKASDESEKHIASFGAKRSVPLKEYEHTGIHEERSVKMKSYPKGLERFLQENEKR